MLFSVLYLLTRNKNYLNEFLSAGPPDSPDKPSIRSSQINARTVTISWRPAPFNGYGPTRNFTVQYKLENNAWSTVPEAIMPSLTTYTVTG